MANQFKLDELICIAKQGSDGAVVELLNARDIVTKIPMFMSDPEITALQRFIKCKGPQPFVVRSVWRVDKPNYNWTISSKTKYEETDVKHDLERFVVNTQEKFGCSIIQSKSGGHVDETVQYIENLVKFLEPNMSVKFTEMVCDFTKDESGIWWFLRVVAFKTDPPAQEPMLKAFLEIYREPIDMT